MDVVAQRALAALALGSAETDPQSGVAFGADETDIEYRSGARKHDFHVVVGFTARDVGLLDRAASVVIADEIQLRPRIAARVTTAAINFRGINEAATAFANPDARKGFDVDTVFFVQRVDPHSPPRFVPEDSRIGFVMRCGILFVNHQNPRQFQTGDGLFQHPAAAARDRNRFDEAVALFDELAERTVDTRVAFASDFMHHEHQAGPAPSDTRSGLDEFGGGEGNAEHPHDVEAVDVCPPCDIIDEAAITCSLSSNCVSGRSRRSKVWRTSSKSVRPVSEAVFTMFCTRIWVSAAQFGLQANDYAVWLIGLIIWYSELFFWSCKACHKSVLCCKFNQ